MKTCKNLSKRGLALFLALVMCLSMVQITAFAVDGHVHNEDGWSCTQDDSVRELSCDKHVHNDNCYQTVQGELTCEAEEHQHGDSCYEAAEPQLTCADAEHTHGDSCYTQGEDVLTCAETEHTHGEDCYAAETVKVCEEEDHQHGDECYTVTEGEWTCTAPVVEEASAEVQAFLDAAAELPDASEVTAENAEEIGEQVSAVLDLYEAIGTETAEVTKALEAVYAVYAAVEAALELEDDTYYGTQYQPYNNAKIIDVGSGKVVKGPTNTQARITAFVGEEWNFQRLPTQTYSGSICGHAMFVCAPKYYNLPSLKSYDDTIVQDDGYTIGTWNDKGLMPQMDGSDCLQWNFTALKPGKTTAQSHYYVRWDNYSNASGGCPICGRPTNGFDNRNVYYEYQDNIPITVNARYQLVYDLNGGTGSISPTTRDIADTTATLGTTGTIPTHPLGYTFKGWKDEAGNMVGSSVTLNWSEGYGSKKNPVTETLTAVWEEDTTPPTPSLEDLTVTKTPSKEYPAVGEEFKYTIEVKNDNDTPVTVKVTDKLNAKLDFVRVSESDGGVYDEDTHTVTWENVTVPAHGSKQLLVWVKANAPGEIYNEAKVQWENGSTSGNTTIEAKGPETVEVPVTIKVRFEGLENGVFADKHAHPDFDLTGASTNPKGAGYYYVGNDHGDGVESSNPYVPYVTFGPEDDFGAWTVEKGKEYDVHFDLGYYQVDGYNYVSANDVPGATGVDFKFQAADADPQTLVITLVYEKVAAPTKPEAPTQQDVYKLVGTVDVYCQPGRHQVGHFDTYKTPGRVEIGSVKESNGTYTCEVVFKAQVYCDAYNVLKNTTGDKAHTLVAGEGDETVIFTWNATEETWERPNDFAPVTFYVECPTGGGENPGPGPGVEPDKAGLKLTKAVDNGNPELGGTVTYTITVSNETRVDLKDLKIKDVMPEGVTLVEGSGKVTVDGAARNVTLSQNDQTCNWTVDGVIPVDGEVVLTYNATVPGAAEEQITLTNIAKAFANQNEAPAPRMAQGVAQYAASMANDFVSGPASTEVNVKGYDFTSNEDNATVTVKPGGGTNPGPVKPGKPDDGDLNKLKLGVQVVCDVENSNHSVTEYLLKTAECTIGEVTENANTTTKEEYPYTCTVQLAASGQNWYLGQTIRGTKDYWNKEHQLADEEKILTATLYHDGEKWTLPIGGGMNPDVAQGTNIKAWKYLVIHTVHKAEQLPGAKDTTYTVVHEYYTNGALTGSNQDTMNGKVGQTVNAENITKVTTYGGNSYTYTSASPESLVLADSENTITLRYDRTTGGNGGGNGGGTTRYTLTVRYEYEDGTQAAPTHTERLARGDAYSVDSPVIEGYTPDQAVVSGEMPGRSLTVTVVYTPEGQDIPDEEPPLVDLPDEEPPLVNIPEEEPPLVEIPEEEPPLAETPLDPTPKTGDNSRTGLWAALCGFSLFGMLALLGKKREDEEA